LVIAPVIIKIVIKVSPERSSGENYGGRISSVTL